MSKLNATRIVRGGKYVITVQGVDDLSVFREITEAVTAVIVGEQDVVVVRVPNGADVRVEAVADDE